MSLGFSVDTLLPKARGGGQLRMGLVKLEEHEWLDPAPVSAERAESFATWPQGVPLTPEVDAPGRDLAAMLSVEGALPEAALATHEDLCLLTRREGEEVYRLIGAAVAWPSDWHPAEKIGLPVATAFRRQDAIAPSSPVYAGNLGYGPNPKLLERVRSADLVIAVGARLGEATTDGYTVPTLEHPGQTLVHIHPDPEELGRVYRTDLAMCCSMDEFAECAALWEDEAIIPFDAGAEANAEWLAWATPQPSGAKIDLGMCVAAMREALPADTMICNGAGNFAGWWHRYWRYEAYPGQLAPTCGAMGYGVPAAVAASLAGASLIVVVVDNGAYGTIRMHQEREYPGRVSATALANPDFAKLGEAYGAWSVRAETTDQFIAALEDAKGRSGIRLIHALTDLERIAASGATITALRARAKATA